MAFWSTDTLRSRIPQGKLVEPYEKARIVHSAYELGVGSEGFVTSSKSANTQIAPGEKLAIPPGQFGLLVTHEEIRVPDNAIAFISIRASIKFKGLVNVSGFHVDPGFQGHLKFAVYNAGSRTIILDQAQPIFMIWFADLDKPDTDPYPPKLPTNTLITAEDVARLEGEVASPPQLKRELDDLRVELDKRFDSSEQSRRSNRELILLLIGAIVGAVLVVLIK